MFIRLTGGLRGKCRRMERRGREGMSQKRVERKGEIFRMRSKKLLVRGWEGWGMRSSRKLKWIWR
jgi:hypothetical protein